MSTQPYSEHGGTTACCRRLIDECVPLGERNCIKGDAWFGSVKSVSKIAEKGQLAVL